MRKNPAPREQKKPRKVVLPQLSSNSELCPTPPSPLQLKKLGRDWTQAEIVDIIRLQQFLQKSTIGLRTRDFKKLWQKSEGKCMLTGFPFDQIEKFPIGIDLIRHTGKRDVDNFRMVLLPLAFSRIRAKQYTLRAEKLPPSFAERPIARALFLSFLEAIENHFFSQTYAVTVRFEPQPADLSRYRWSPGVYNMKVMGVVFPIDRWYRKEETKSNEKGIITATLDDNKASVTISGRQFDAKSKMSKITTVDLQLCNPNCDFAAVFTAMYEESFRTTLANGALQALGQWNY
jgi:hypothetical protein